MTSLGNLLVGSNKKVKIQSVENMHLDSAKSLIIKAKNITEDADTIKLNGGTGVITCEHAQASVLAQAIANAVLMRSLLMQR